MGVLAKFAMRSSSGRLGWGWLPMVSNPKSSAVAAADSDGIARNAVERSNAESNLLCMRF
jgi:hypothetical protein